MDLQETLKTSCCHKKELTTFIITFIKQQTSWHKATKVSRPDKLQALIQAVGR